MTIVSILGLGRWNREKGTHEYDKASYQWGEREVITTVFLQEAFARWFPEARFVLLATEKAKEEQEVHLKRIPNRQVVRIPHGQNPQEFWEIYGKITDHLEAGSEVILDITHGFRSLGMLAFLAVVFLQAARRVRLLHLLYAAHEAKVDEITPIFDLTPFVSMLDWASATSRFLETGDVRRLAQISGAFSEDLKDSVGNLQTFSTALQLHDPLQVGRAAHEGLAALERVREKLPAPMKILEDRLVNSISPLAFTDQDPQERQLLALFHQVLWYRQHGHHEKAVGLASEWIHLFAKWRTGHDIWSTKFGLKSELETIGDDWARELKDLHEEIKGLRDNISHWQFKRKDDLQPLGLEATPSQVEELIDRLEKLVRGAGLSLPETAVNHIPGVPADEG